MRVVSILLEENTAHQVRVIAAHDGTTRSALIRSLVESYLKDWRDSDPERARHLFPGQDNSTDKEA